MSRHIEFDRLHNFRDLGGYPADDGRTVRWGRLYRSDSLSKLRGDDWDRFLQLGIRTVIDLRYPWEAEASGRVPEADDVMYHNLSIEHQPYDQAALTADVEPAQYLAERYAEVAEDGVAELRQVLQVIAEALNGGAEAHGGAEAGGPAVVFHCASGKDRTGIVGALVLALLGVSRPDIVADFALTGLATERLTADWHAAHPGRTLHWPGYAQAPPDLMRRFLSDLEAQHGSVRNYVTDELGVGDDVIDTLRRQLLS